MPATGDPFGYKARLKRLGLTQIEAGEALGWSAKKAHRFMSGDHKNPSIRDARQMDEWIRRREAQAGVLREKEGGSFDALPESLTRRPAQDQEKTTRRAPVYGLVGGASGTLHLNHDAVVGYVDLPVEMSGGAETFLAEVFGPSMEPRYRSGERAVAVRNRPPRPGDDCIIELKNGDAYLKIYVAIRDGIVWCDQWNKEEVTDDTRLHWPLKDVTAIHAVQGRW